MAINDSCRNGARAEALNIWSLPSPDRVVGAIAAIALIWTANAILVPIALPPATVREQDGSYYLMSYGGKLAVLIRTLTVLGVVAGALACRRALSRWVELSTERHDWAKRTATRTAWVVLTAVSVPLISDMLYDSLWLEGDTFWIAAAGWLSLCGSLVLLALRPRTGQLPLQATLTFLPFAAWLAVQIGLGRLGEPWEAAASYRADALRALIANVEVLLVGYVLWSALEWADVVATGAARVIRPRARVLTPILAGVKALWLGAGLAGILPGVLGGDLGVWAEIRHDGWGSWLAAAALAVVLLWLLVRVSSAAIPAADVGLKNGIVLLFGLVLALPGMVAGAWQTLRGLLVVVMVHPQSATAFGVCLGAALVGRLLAHQPGRPLRYVAGVAFAVAASMVAARAGSAGLGGDVVYVPELVWLGGYYFLIPATILVVAGLVVWARLRRAARIDGAVFTAAVFFGLALAPTLFYAAPRVPQIPLPIDHNAIGATGDMYTVANADEFVDDRPAAIEGPFNGPGGSFELATLDSALSAFAIALLLTRRARQDERLSSLVVLTLVCFWILSYSGWLSLPSWRGEIWFYVALILPVAWQLLVRAHPFNVGAPDVRSAASLGILGLAGLVFAVAGYRSLTGEMTASRPYGDTVFAYAGEFGVRYWLIGFGLIAVVDRILELRSSSGSPGH